MTALFIIVGILSLILFILFSDVNIKCSYDGVFKYKIRYLFYNKRFKKKKKKSKISLLNGAEDWNFDELKQMTKKEGIIGTIKEICATLKVLLVRLGIAVRHLRVKKLNLLIDVATDDPAKTAVEYGAVCSAVYPVLSSVQEYVRKWNKSKTDVTVNCNFLKEEPEFYFDIKLKIRLIYIIRLYIDVIVDLVKRKVKETLEKDADYQRRRAELKRRFK